MDEPLTSPNADFGYGQTFHEYSDDPGERYVILDAGGRLVASLPWRMSGELRTREGIWQVATERRKVGWAVIARTVPDGAEAGGARQRLFPNVYGVWVNPDLTYRLTQRPFGGTWQISRGRTALARLDGTLAGGPRSSFGRPHWTIETLDRPMDGSPIALPILLSLELIKQLQTIPSVSGGP